jgi:hypothetical protein
MKRIFALLLLSFIAISIQAQSEIYYVPPSPKPSFEDMLRGVEYAVLVLTDPNKEIHYAKEKGYTKYLRQIGFKTIIESHPNIDVSELFDMVRMKYAIRKDVLVVWSLNGDDESIFVFDFQSLFYDWKFSSFSHREINRLIQKYDYDFEKVAYEEIKKAYPYKKPPYNKNYELRLPKRKTTWTKTRIINDFEQNGLQDIEGIYENSSGINQAKRNVY